MMGRISAGSQYHSYSSRLQIGTAEQTAQKEKPESVSMVTQNEGIKKYSEQRQEPIVKSGVSDKIPFLRQGADPAEWSVRMRMQEDYGIEGVQKALEKGECQTCKERKYQDGSDDPGVSFKTPAHISPEQAVSTVRGHEMEHVTRESVKAERENRKVVSQSVTLHTSICPECGTPYVSGGTTRTTTKAKPEQDRFALNERAPFDAFA